MDEFDTYMSILVVAYIIISMIAIRSSRPVSENKNEYFEGNFSYRFKLTVVGHFNILFFSRTL